MTNIHPKFKEIEGAQELLEKVEKNFNEIDLAILDLESRKKELEETLQNNKEKITAESFKNQAAAKQELLLISQAIASAQNEKEKINDVELYRNVEELIKKHREKVNEAYTEEIKTIIEKLYEIRIMYRNLVKAQSKEFGLIEKFIVDISPYFNDDLAEKLNTDPTLALRKSVLKNDKYYGVNRFIDLFDEGDYGVEGGLFEQSKNINTSVSVNGERVRRSTLCNKKFNINIDDIKVRLNGEKSIPSI